jgi:hypothetical protein
MAQEVTIKSRVLLQAATVDDPQRKVYQIMYQVGELPPHFVFIPEKGYTKEKEAKAIQDDLKKRLAKPPEETITIPE